MRPGPDPESTLQEAGVEASLGQACLYSHSQKSLRHQAGASSPESGNEQTSCNINEDLGETGLQHTGLLHGVPSHSPPGLLRGAPSHSPKVA